MNTDSTSKNPEVSRRVRIVTPEEAATLDPATVANGYDRPAGCLLEKPNLDLERALGLTIIPWRMPSTTISVPSSIRLGMHEETYPDISLDEDFIRRFINGHKWRFALTMKWCPHSYVVRGKNGMDDREFYSFARQIRAFGYDERWRKYNNRYLDFDGYKYWTMGYVLGVTKIINRAKLEAPPRPFSQSPQKFLAKPPTNPKDPILPPE